MSNRELSPAFKYLVLSIPATILVIVPGFVDPINLPKLLTLIAFCFVSVTLFLAMRKYRSPVDSREIAQKLIVALYYALGAGMLITGILGNQNYIRTFFGTNGRNNGLIYYISVVIMAVVILKMVISKPEIKYIQAIISWTSIAFAGYCTLQFLEMDPIKWTNPYNRVIGTLGNPNFSSSALATFAVFWIYSFMRTSVQKSRKLIYLFPAFLMAFLSWSTASLQGMVVLALGLGLICFVALREKYSAKIIPYLFFSIGGISLILAFISFAGRGPFGSTFEQYTLKLRGYYASYGLQAMINSPWYGIGVDNYNSAFRSYRTQDFISRYGVSLSTNNAHSTPAQIGASFGFIVFALYCSLHIWILYNALKIINSRENSFYFLKGLAILWILVFSQSLLSIEIIGLGVMNWIVGAVLLSANLQLNFKKYSQGNTERDKLRAKVLPEWVGPLTILLFLVGAIPTAPISIEDRAYRNILSMQVQNQDSKNWIADNYYKLSPFTLWDSDKVEKIVYNLSQAGLYKELESTLQELYRVDPKDVYANDLLASYFRSTNQIDKEIEIREKLRSFDPVNFQLELTLAQAYARKGDIVNLAASTALIKSIAPASQEYKDAESLLAQMKTAP